MYAMEGDLIGYNVYAMYRRTDIWGTDAHAPFEASYTLVRLLQHF